MLIQYLNSIVSTSELHQGSSGIAQQTALQLTQCFRNIFQLTHKLGTDCAIKIAVKGDEWSELPCGTTTFSSNRSWTSVIRRSRVPPHAWVGSITSWSQPDAVVKSRVITLSRLLVLEPNHSWWWPFMSPINKNVACTSSDSMEASDVTEHS